MKQQRHSVLILLLFALASFTLFQFTPIFENTENVSPMVHKDSFIFVDTLSATWCF